MSNRLWVFLALSLVVGFAPAPFPRSGRERPRNDLDRLQGTWEVIEARQSGSPLDVYVGGRVQVVGKRWSFFQKGEQVSHYSWDLDLNARATPAAMDFNGVDGSTSSRAIYRFDQDTLTLNYAPDGERPSRFARDRDFYLVLKRVDR
jgi:uncharacterized protein (TIGR03067 family)